MKDCSCQQGSVLVVSLLMLLVMTVLGVSAMLGSQLQERMVGNQKQAIAASLAAESGAVLAMQWLEMNPAAWGDVEAWKANEALPSGVSSARDGGGGVVYWIERLDFAGDVATIVSRGGVLVEDRVIGQNAVAVVLQNEDYKAEHEDSSYRDHHQAPSNGNDSVAVVSVKSKVLAWRQVAVAAGK